MNRKIQPIEKSSIHRICSGQVILDLASAVKELLENSLDAGATTIEVKLREYGAESFEVADNGCGVSPENYQGLTLKYHTSKISDFSDLRSLTSFGFRGEALSSLCALADVTIHTRSKDQPVGVQLVFDHSGHIVSQKNLARTIGTTVSVGKLFYLLPVRHKEFNRNIRREYARLHTVLQAYALIGKGVRLICTSQTEKGGRSNILHTQGTNSIKDNIITVFGTKTAACLDPLSVSVAEGFSIEGFVSKPGAGCGRPSGDRQYFYINGRPVDMPKVSKLLNELYKSFNSQQYPMAILNFILSPAAYDINVTPDKRKVFLHEENNQMIALREALEKAYASNKYIFPVHNLEGPFRSPTEDELIDYETQVSPQEFDDEEIGKIEHLKDAAKNLSPHFVMDSEDCTPPSKVKVDISSFRHMVSVTKSQHAKVLNSGNGPKEVRSTGTVEVKSTGGGPRNARNLQKVQSKLFNFVSKKQKNEDGCPFSEEPLLQNRKDSETVLNGFSKKVADQSILAFESGKQKNEDETLLTVEPLLQKRQFSGLVQEREAEIDVTKYDLRHGSEGEFVSKKRRNEDGCLFSEEPLLKKCKDSEVVPDEFPKKLVDQSKLLVFEPKKNEDGTLLTEGPFLQKRRVSDGLGQELQAETELTKYDLRHGSEGEHMRPTHQITKHKSHTELSDFVETSNHEVFRQLEVSEENNSPSMGVDKENPISSIEGVDDDKDKPTLLADRTDLTLIPTSHSNMLEEIAMVAGKTSNEGEIQNSVIDFDLKALQVKLARGLINFRKDKVGSRQKGRQSKRSFTAASVTLDGVPKEGTEKETALAAATSELERSFNKADFKRMEVIGQFNLGFIIAKLDDDLFIIDQHASDEKRNFEHLIKTTMLNRQPLLRPLVLDLSIAEETVIATHMEAFRQNGFDFIEQKDAIPGQRLRLTAVPFSKNIVFGVPDVQELISVLSDEPVYHSVPFSQQDLSGMNTIRPSRVRSMLASRACRYSIMIGDALSKKEMEKVVSRLAELDAPWNCPHGRPTMRHLADLNVVRSGQHHR